MLALLLVCVVVPTTVQKAEAQDAVTREVQRLLTEQGYDPGPIDGFMGRRTEGALKAYQKANGLSVTGRPDAETTILLRHNRIVSPPIEKQSIPSPSETPEPEKANERTTSPGSIPVSKQDVGNAPQTSEKSDRLPVAEPTQEHKATERKTVPEEAIVRRPSIPPVKKNDNSTPVVSNQTKKSTDINPWWWVAALVGGGILFLRRRKKKESSQKAESVCDFSSSSAFKSTAQSGTAGDKGRIVHTASMDAHEQRIQTGSQFGSGYPGKQRLAPASSPNQGARWVPQGHSVEIAGRNIGGLVYVGTPPRVGQYREKCRAYIDPMVSVSRNGNDLDGNGMGYWPSYSEISTSSRATYLEWLGSGRKDADYNPGYMFLYFYGLERRFFLDNPGQDEKQVIFSEVRRLKSLYTDNYSVQKYLGSFLDFASIVVGEANIEAVASRRYDYDVPFSVKVLIGTFLEQGQSLDADLMLHWWRLHPESQVRTVARRCPEEFRALFQLKFTDRYPSGLAVTKPKRLLKGTYVAASSEFTIEVTPEVDGKKLSDISNLRKPVTIAQGIADAAMNELDKFSRYLGRNPEGRGSLEAHALLPSELWPLFPSEELKGLSNWAETIITDTGLVPLVEVIHKLEGAYPEKVGKRQLTGVADALARLGIGLAPDPRFALRNPKIGDPVVLFRLPDDSTQLENVTDSYRAALTQLAVGTFVAQADGNVAPSEEEALRKAVVSRSDLTPAEQARLLANLKWLLVVPPEMNTLRNRLKAATGGEQKAIRDFAVAMAHADSFLRPEEVGGIEKIYRALGVDPERAYSDLHSTAFKDEPVTVRSEQKAKDRELLPPEGAPQLSLDADRIAAIQSDTESVSNVLGAIFGNDQVDDGEEAEDVGAAEVRFAGLAAGHTAFLSELIQRDHWTDTEFEELAGRHKLMTAGCLETINEWAYGNFDDALIEEYDGYDLNIDVVQELRDNI